MKFLFIRDNIQALVIAAFLSGLFFMWKQHNASVQADLSRATIEAMPAENFFEVKTMNVPNFVEGENPLMAYDRSIKKEFFGSWIAAVHQVGNGTDYPICTGNGDNHYVPTEAIPKTGVTLEWFVGKDCALPPGDYILHAAWEITGKDFDPKHYTHDSNIFKVLPKGSQLFITPEQSKKLN